MLGLLGLFATLPLTTLGEGLVDLTLYGGAFEASSTIAYAEVAQMCFGGLEVGSCEPSSPNWLIDFLDQYNEGTTGKYCASCCSNTDSSGDIWTFTCPLLSSSFADFVNIFAWEFRFRRRETASDTEVVSCAIPRTACSYGDDGELSGACESDGSYLVAYVLTIEVMTVENGLKSWKSVRGCSVEVEESTEEPASLAETIVMTQVYADGSGIEAGWAALIALVAFSITSCGVRYARDERCRICGNHLIWFWKVCSPCRFYGYDPPSKDVMEVMPDCLYGWGGRFSICSQGPYTRRSTLHHIHDHDNHRRHNLTHNPVGQGAGKKNILSMVVSADKSACPDSCNFLCFYDSIQIS